MTVPISMVCLWFGFQAPAAQVSPVEAASVSGRVVNTATGKPVERATVWLTRFAAGAATNLHTVTDAGGAFSFPTVEPGNYTIGAVRAGFAVVMETASQGTGGSVNIALAPGAKVAGLKLRLTPEAIISGRVTDELGEPLPGVSVRLMHPVYVNGQRQLQRIETIIGTTNDRGEYRIFDLAPGRYYVVATGGNSGAAFDRAFPVFYPGVADPSAARMFDVKPGSEFHDINLMLLPARLTRLRGRVVDAANGQPVGGAHITPAPKGSAFNSASSGSGATSNAQGEWEIDGAWPGPYFVSADAVRGQERLIARVSVDLPPAGLDDILLSVTPGAEVAGTVRLEGERGRSEFNSAHMRVLLQAQEYDAGSAASAVTPAGGFTFRTLRPATYFASAMALPESLYLKSVRFEKQETINTGFEVGEPKSYHLDLAVSGDGAQLSGTVRDSDGAPSAGATVVLVPADPALGRIERLYKTASTGHDGKYLLQGIPPGAYRLYCWEEVEPGIWFEPDFLRAYEGEAAEVSLAANDRKTADLKAPGTAAEIPR
jgi:protocatechuate 3,4-dioxygenase beta subunit